MEKIIKFFENLLLKFMSFLKIPEKIQQKAVQFIEFCVVGVSNTLIHYAVYALLVFLRLNYVLANLIAFLISVTNAFYWNNKYVFKTRQGEKRSLLPSFLKTVLSYGITGLGLSTVLLILWVEILHLPELLGPVLNLLVTIPLNFLLNKFWAFGSKLKPEESGKL